MHPTALTAPDAGRICAAFPWPEMAVIGTVCLLAGLTIGFVWGRVTSSFSGEPMAERLHTAYNRWSWLVAVLIGVLALVGIWIGTVASITNSRQDAQRAAENKARDQYNAALLKCFDTFANDLTDALPPIRVATAARDTAQAKRDAALNDLVKALLTSNEEQIRASFADLRATGDGLVRAQAELTRVRAANPYPAAPSTFCNPTAKP